MAAFLVFIISLATVLLISVVDVEATECNADFAQTLKEVTVYPTME
jgi:hypothetical protein